MPDTSEINKSLSSLEQELSTLKSASDEIQKAKDFAQSSFLESKKLLDTTISDIQTSLSALSSHIDEYKLLSEELLNSARKNNEIVVTESKRLNKSAIELFNTVDILREKIDKIDFPNRLDKLDTAVTGINTVIQNLFGRFETVERNLKDKFQTRTADLEKSLSEAENKLSDEFETKSTKLENSISSAEKNLRDDLLESFEKNKKINLILFISVLVVSLGSLVTLLLKLVF